MFLYLSSLQTLILSLFSLFVLSTWPEYWLEKKQPSFGKKKASAVLFLSWIHNKPHPSDRTIIKQMLLSSKNENKENVLGCKRKPNNRFFRQKIQSSTVYIQYKSFWKSRYINNRLLSLSLWRIYRKIASINQIRWGIFQTTRTENGLEIEDKELYLNSELHVKYWTLSPVVGSCFSQASGDFWKTLVFFATGL